MACTRAVILVLHAVINMLPTKFIAQLNGFSAVWHFIGTFVLIVLLPAVAPTHQSASYGKQRMALPGPPMPEQCMCFLFHTRMHNILR
jgi:amino acid transporter